MDLLPLKSDIFYLNCKECDAKYHSSLFEFCENDCEIDAMSDVENTFMIITLSFTKTILFKHHHFEAFVVSLLERQLAPGP